jgi:hypothetical protein
VAKRVALPGMGKAGLRVKGIKGGVRERRVSLEKLWSFDWAFSSLALNLNNGLSRTLVAIKWR